MLSGQSVTGDNSPEQALFTQKPEAPAEGEHRARAAQATSTAHEGHSGSRCPSAQFPRASSGAHYSTHCLGPEDSACKHPDAKAM